jgi:hypothetical protein
MHDHGPSKYFIRLFASEVESISDDEVCCAIKLRRWEAASDSNP